MRRVAFVILAGFLTTSGVAPSQAFPDAEGDRMLNPGLGGPLMGDSCPRTDVLDLDFGASADGPITFFMSDLNAPCEGQNPNFQFFSYKLLFDAADGSSVVAYAWLNGLNELEEARMQIQNPDGSPGPSIWIEGAVNVANDTVLLKLPLSWIAEPYTALHGVTVMEDCTDTSCTHPRLAAAADRVPSLGFLRWEGAGGAIGCDGLCVT